MFKRYSWTLAAALVAASLPAGQLPALAESGVSDGPVAGDRAVTTDGDMTGLHVLVADADDGYAWRTAATLREPGTGTDQWIGQSCVTGSGRRAVVVYAPREFTNHAELFARGGLAAVVDLDTGSVTKLSEPVNLAYYNPGCGAGETAVLTEELAGVGGRVTRLITVDTVTAAITATVDVPGQVTSAVPTRDGTVAVSGNRLVRVDGDGSLTTLVRTEDVPFRLAVAGDGAVGYETQRGDRVAVHRYASGRDRVVLTAAARSVRLAGVAGTVYVRGAGADRFTGLPDRWRGVDTPVDAELSTTGALAVTSAVNARETVGGTTLGGVPTGILEVRITTTRLAVGQTTSTTVVPVGADPSRGGAPSPAVSGVPGHGGGLAPNGTGDQTTDPDRACAIPRNDPRIQTLQPTAAMSEWAADRAVMGTLTIARPAGYNGSDLPAYSPQGMFPPVGLRGGGHVPAQVLLGVMAQESNMWQASPHAVDGESGNFEQGGFYGRAGINTVDFGNADCGYGATQVTTGMEIGDGVYTHDQQVALTVDYAANIAAGLQILQDKWNQMWDLGVIANDGDPQYIENWWFALWAYNTGWHFANDPSDPFSRPDAFGLGWSNNVRNTDYPADRELFLANSTECDDNEKDPSGNCIDAKHPNDWSYPERVMGFAFFSLTRFDFQSGFFDTTFAPGLWHFGPRIPGLDTFCSLEVNDCDPATDPGTIACTRADFTCFWHASSTWIPDMGEAGTEVVVYDSADPEPAVGFHQYRTDCTRDQLPSNALIVDDVPGVSTVNGCGGTLVQHGDLTFAFAEDNTGHFPSKIDFHQLDTGFNGHFWFAHAWEDTAANAIHEVTGTWTLDRTLDQWARVWVYVPDHGAADPQAFYTVHGSDSTSPSRSVVEGNYLDDNREPAAGVWESLGAFHFSGTTPSVSLTNMTGAVVGDDFADGDRDVAWDAVAFEPLPAEPANQVVVLGDSYTSGEGASGGEVDGHWDYYRSSDHDGSGSGDDLRFRDACHRSPFAWSRRATLPDSSATVADRLAAFDQRLTYHMSACSGAVTANILAGGTGQYGEGSQLDQGYLDQHTTLVMLSIGGNDARFSDIVQACIVSNPFQDCQDSTLDGDTQPLSTSEPALIDNQVGPAVEDVITQIQARAPNAQILLMGYPEVFEPIEVVGAPCVTLISFGEQDWLAGAADVLDDRLARAVSDLRASGIAVTFADPRPAFTGRGVCGDPSRDLDPRIRNITVHVTRGEDPNARLWGDLGIVSDQSFHPSIDGAATYATVATTTVRDMFGQ